MARVPEVQRVSTLAGSEVYGGFTLKFFDEETDQLPHNATAEEVKNCWHEVDFELFYTPVASA